VVPPAPAPSEPIPLPTPPSPYGAPTWVLVALQAIMLAIGKLLIGGIKAGRKAEYPLVERR
jgi:hypothetical protein